jgi:hypothetical protein
MLYICTLILEMDENIEKIENSFNEVDSSLFDYRIEALFPFDKTWVNITGLFNSPSELKEVGIGKKDRRLIAKNEEGYFELIDLGFKDKEIIKEYGER